MISHHALLGALFSLFEDEAKEKSPRAGSSLSELAWETKKHFFAEENAIFNLPQIKDMGVFKMVHHLKEEHVMMLDYLKRFADDLPEIKEGDVEKFAGLLEGHREAEEKELYPKLDQELPEDQKKQIVFRINEIPINK